MIDIEKVKELALDGDLCAVQELITRLEAAEQDARLRFDSFAGIVIWINNLRVCRKISEAQITYEAVPGMVLTNETQRCLDEIAAMKEMK